MQSCSFLHDSEFAMPNLQMIQETQRRKSTDKSDKELVVCCLGHGSPALIVRNGFQISGHRGDTMHEKSASRELCFNRFFL